MKFSRTSLIVLIIALLALAVGLGACGEKSGDATGETQALSLTLDFNPNPDHVGFYMAQKLGYFKEAGLDVSIHTPADPSAPLKLLAAGRTDLAISHEPEVILAKERGLDVIAVASLVNRPLTSMIWLQKSGIKSVADLRGKTIATAGVPYQEAFLKILLADAGLEPSDVKTIDVGYGLLPALLSGRAQAILGGFNNIEGIELLVRKSNPVFYGVDDLGLPSYDELVLTAQRKRVEEDPEAIRLFIAALSRGTAAAVAHPKAALKTTLEANSNLNPKFTSVEVQETLHQLVPTTPPPYFGYMDPAVWRTFIGWMRDNELISSPLEPSKLLSDAYLPGASPQ